MTHRLGSANCRRSIHSREPDPDGLAVDPSAAFISPESGVSIPGVASEDESSDEHPVMAAVANVSERKAIAKFLMSQFLCIGLVDPSVDLLGKTV